jgi:hypothetical protein
MPNPAPEPQVPADEAPDPSVLRAERQLRVLEEATEICMKLLRAVEPGDSVAGSAKGKDLADALGTITRALRLTVALEHKIDADLRDLKAGIVQEKEEERTRTAKSRKAAVEAREYKVRALVIEAAEAEIDDVEAFQQLFEALEERLGEDEAYEGFGERPLGETVERLCADLKLNPDWRHWDGQGWIRNGPRARPRWSEFNQPSAKPILWAPPPRSRSPSPNPVASRTAAIWNEALTSSSLASARFSGGGTPRRDPRWRGGPHLTALRYPPLPPSKAAPWLAPLPRFSRRKRWFNMPRYARPYDA